MDTGPEQEQGDEAAAVETRASYRFLMDSTVGGSLPSQRRFGTLNEKKYSAPAGILFYCFTIFKKDQ